MANVLYTPTAPTAVQGRDYVRAAAPDEQAMPPSRAAAVRHEPSLVQLCEPLLNMILALQTPDRFGDVATLYAQLQRECGALRHSAAAAGINEQDIQLAVFALVAFADETIAESAWIDRTQWPFLQYEYFNTRRAGELFFDHLQQIQGRGYDYTIWKQSTRADLLEVYYLCLLLGFRGAWAFNAPVRVQHELEQIQRHVRARRIGQLAPNAAPRPYRNKIHGTAAAWMWIALLIHAALIGGLVLIYLP